LFFSAYDVPAHGVELWKSDGSPAGTTLVKDINPGGGHSFPGDFTVAGGTLFFTAIDGPDNGTTNGRELWKTDGTPGGTQLVEDINPGGNGSPNSPAAVGDTLLFQATDGTNGFELWRSDGTAMGTQMVKDITPGPSGSYPNELAEFGGTLFFSASDGTNGRE